MANQPQPFRQHHITRALKAAAASGMSNLNVEVRLPTGATIVIGGKPDEVPPTKAVGKGARSGRSLALPAKAGRTAPPTKGK